MIDYDVLEDIRTLFKGADEENHRREDEVWESLDYDTQLDVFCAIVRKLKHGEIDEGRSYRGILYDTFGFDMDAYGRAQAAGFLDIHNAITPKSEIYHILETFIAKHNLNVTNEQLIEFVKGV